MVYLLIYIFIVKKIDKSYFFYFVISCKFGIFVLIVIKGCDVIVWFDFNQKER